MLSGAHDPEVITAWRGVVSTSRRSHHARSDLKPREGRRKDRPGRTILQACSFCKHNVFGTVEAYRASISIGREGYPWLRACASIPDSGKDEQSK